MHAGSLARSSERSSKVSSSSDAWSEPYNTESEAAKSSEMPLLRDLELDSDCAAGFETAAGGGGRGGLAAARASLR